MQLNLTTDYAIRFLLCLGREKGTVRGGEVAESMCIPPKYLLKIARRLREAGMIGAIEGVKGGYYLRRPLDQLPLLDVLRVMEPTMAINRCLEADHYCSRGMEAGCPVRRYYARMQRKMEEKWLSKTLAQILEEGAEESCEDGRSVCDMPDRELERPAGVIGRARAFV